MSYSESQDVMRDAGVSIQAGTTAEDIIAPLIGATVYFTAGELIPWKGKWWQVRLLNVEGEKLIGLSMQKDTAAAMKLAKRKARWKARHPQAGLQALRSHGLPVASF